MLTNKFMAVVCCALLIAGCSRQQGDWQKTREANTPEAYEQFVKQYPSGEFTAQAQVRLKELYEERDWQKARDADTPEAYQAFLKQYPEGKWTEEARIRVENFTLAQTPSGQGPSGQPSSGEPPSGQAPAGEAPSSASPPSVAAQKPHAPQSPSAHPSSPRPLSARQGATATAPAGKMAPATSKTASKTASGYAVQLGAFKSGRAAASKHWEHLQKEYPKLLAGLSPKVIPKKTTAGTLYRLQAMGVSEHAAREICKSLKAKSQPCVIVPPAPA